MIKNAAATLHHLLMTKTANRWSDALSVARKPYVAYPGAAVGGGAAGATGMHLLGPTEMSPEDAAKMREQQAEAAAGLKERLDDFGAMFGSEGERPSLWGEFKKLPTWQQFGIGGLGGLGLYGGYRGLRDLFSDDEDE